MHSLLFRHGIFTRSVILVQRSKNFRECGKFSSSASIQPFANELQQVARSEESEILPYQTFPEKQVKVFTCEKLFEKWRKERRYWYVHNRGVSFDMPYVDTGYQTQSATGEQPIVVALHGSPGTYESFSYMTAFMHRHGARVIAPSFPDLTSRKKREFRHSSEEKRELVKDFLTTINVPRVDMLMCHSSSLFPGLLLCLENKSPVINSLCLINPTAFDYPRSLQPLWAVKTLSLLYEFPVGKELTKLLGKLFVASKKNLKGGCYLEHFLSGFTLVQSNIPQGAYHFQELLNRNFPVFLAFSENDKLIHKKSLYKMANMMLNDSEIRKYNKNGKMEFNGGNHPTRQVVSFENGTHFLYKKYPQLLSENVTAFLLQIAKNQVHQQRQ